MMRKPGMKGGGGVLTALAMLVCAQVGWADTGDRYEQVQPSSPRVLVYRPEASTAVDPRATRDSGDDGHEGPPGSIRVFYPVRGQSSSGLCWMGLAVDSRNNVYPFFGNVSRIRPDGTLVNGANDTNYFATGGLGFWFSLDEKGGVFYNAGGSELLSAPFREGSTFSPLLSGFELAEAITLGQGPLAGSLFVTEPTVNRVSRVTLSPLGLSVFSSGPFTNPESIASAPDGTLYVVNLGATPPELIRIAPDGTPSLFATGTVGQVNRAIAVDRAGNVYWSRAEGFVKYDASGAVVGMLPGPPDKPAFGNPMGAAFDRHGNLFVVDNGDCKKVYEYRRVGDMAGPVVIDIEPGDDTNEVGLEHNARVKVAILSTAELDATRVSPSTVRFGATGTEAGPVSYSRKDVNGDGRLDKVLCFKVRQTGLTCDSTSAVLTGSTRDGTSFRGTGAVRPTGSGCR
ncbi:NHL repeat-containing protein [Archangium lipolyticum]|uniref:hypothetical protein n=1 Tax=Archangium lipolyticum TaxID=2970465 RepID=UPI00214A47C3|nr:hypothetical protein [Archangium lipolyticum]